MNMEPTDVLRSSFTCSGTRIMLVYDEVKLQYRLCTRWRWLTQFDNIWDACDAFEALEMSDGQEKDFARWCKREIARVPRTRFVRPSWMGRISYLVSSVERRLVGLRPVRCGSKGSVERWVEARASHRVPNFSTA